MEKTREHFKKIRGTKETFHARMDTTNDREGKDLTVAEKVKKWQGYTALYNYAKEVLMTWITTIMWSFTKSQKSWSMTSNRP